MVQIVKFCFKHALMHRCFFAMSVSNATKLFETITVVFVCFHEVHNSITFCRCGVHESGSRSLNKKCMMLHNYLIRVSFTIEFTALVLWECFHYKAKLVLQLTYTCDIILDRNLFDLGPNVSELCHIGRSVAISSFNKVFFSLNHCVCTIQWSIFWTMSESKNSSFAKVGCGRNSTTATFVFLTAFMSVTYMHKSPSASRLDSRSNT